MAEKFISERNLKFLPYEVFDTPSLTQYSYFADHSRESFDMALETAMKIGKNPDWKPTSIGESFTPSVISSAMSFPRSKGWPNALGMRMG
jgi:hypothetical protein